MVLVLHHSKASGAAQMILMGIANHQGDGGAWPAISTLAKYGKVSERRVQQIIRDLEASGELRVDYQAGGKTSSGATNLYQVILSCPPECDGTMNHRPVQGVKSGDARGEISDTRGEIWSQQGVKPTSPEPVIKPNLRNQTEPYTSPTVSNVTEDDSTRLCHLLADLIEGNGSRRPLITNQWLSQARLLLVQDHRPLDEVVEVLRWSQQDSFWRANILSMPKFRKKYDTLRLQRLQHSPVSNAQRNLDVVAQFAQLEQKELGK